MALGSKEPIVGEWNSGWHQHSAQQGNKDWGLRVMTACKTRHPHWRGRHLSPISKPLRFNVCYQRQSHSSKWQNCIREPLKLTPPPNTHTPQQPRPIHHARRPGGSFYLANTTLWVISYSVRLFGRQFANTITAPTNLIKDMLAALKGRWVQRNQNKEVSSASLVAQWLKFCLAMQGTLVQSLVREDPTFLRATKPAL